MNGESDDIVDQKKEMEHKLVEINRPNKANEKIILKIVSSKTLTENEIQLINRPKSFIFVTERIHIHKILLKLTGYEPAKDQFYF